MQEFEKRGNLCLCVCVVLLRVNETDHFVCLNVDARSDIEWWYHAVHGGLEWGLHYGYSQQFAPICHSYIRCLKHLWLWSLHGKELKWVHTKITTKELTLVIVAAVNSGRGRLHSSSVTIQQWLRFSIKVLAGTRRYAL